MAQKKIDPEKKWAAVIRHLTEGRTVDEERRRLGVTKQAFNRWVQQYLKAHPEADRRPKAQEPPPPPPPPEAPAASPAVPDPAPPSAPAAATPGAVDQPALAAALKADGDITSSQRPPSAPPAPGQLSLSTEAEDMAIVEGAGNQVMGLGTRGMIFAYELIYGAKISGDAAQRLQELYLLTPTEKAMLKPASRHVALWLREKIGSDSNVSLGVAGSTIGTGLFDRARVIGEAVAQAVARKRAEMAAAEAAAAKGGAA